MTDHNEETADSSNATEHDPERVDDVEITPGDVFVNLTRESDSQILLVTAVGDITELAPKAIPDHPEATRRVERDPEAVIFKSDGTGLETPVTMDARTFRRKVFEERFHRIRRPKHAAYLFLQSRHADPEQKTAPGELDVDALVDESEQEEP